MLVDALSATLRALSFLALFQATGTSIFIALFGPQLLRTRDLLHRVALLAALAAMPLLVAHYALEGARMGGELSAVLDASLQRLALHSTMSAALLLRVLGLALVIIGLVRRGRLETPLLLLGSALVVLAFTTVGHTTTHAPRSVLALLVAFHVAVAALWFGALAPLAAVSAREPAVLAAAIVRRFSRLAGRLVPGLFAAGVLLATLLLPNVRALGSDYGRLLLAKVTGFAALMGLAALNKWRLGPALAHGDARIIRAFQRSLIAEYVLLAAVLCVTAVLTSFYSP